MMRTKQCHGVGDDAYPRGKEASEGREAKGSGIHGPACRSLPWEDCREGVVREILYAKHLDTSLDGRSVLLET